MSSRAIAHQRREVILLPESHENKQGLNFN